MEGQGFLIASMPLPDPSISRPSASRITGTTPKKGNVAEPGFNGVQPGNGVNIGAA